MRTSISKELAGLKVDVSTVRRVLGASNPQIQMLCNTLEAFVDTDVILLLAEAILRERRICDVAFCEPSDVSPGDLDYNHEGAEVAVIVMQADEDKPLLELQGHETLAHAYRSAEETLLRELN